MEHGNFDRDASVRLKGIAILLLVFHHCFYKSDLFAGYAVNFFPFAETAVIDLAQMCKLVVSIFAFISGYGLWLSCKNNTGGISPSGWAAVRYIRTFSGFWIIWALIAVITQIVNGNFTAVFFSRNNRIDSMINVITDAIGLEGLFHTHTLDENWWYMSAAFIFILTTPFLVKGERYLPLILVWVIVFIRFITGKNGGDIAPGTCSAYEFTVPFVLGAIFAKYDLVNRIIRCRFKWVRFIAEAGLLVLGYTAFSKIDVNWYWELRFGLIAIVLIMFLTEFVINIPYLRNVLSFFGKHSMNIYLIHGTLKIYLDRYIYSAKHFVLISLLLFALSLLVSAAVEFLKEKTRYNKAINRLCDRITAVCGAAPEN